MTSLQRARERRGHTKRAAADVCREKKRVRRLNRRAAKLNPNASIELINERNIT